MDMLVGILMDSMGFMEGIDKRNLVGRMLIEFFSGE